MKKFRKCKMEIKIIIFILFSTIIFIGCETDEEKGNKIFSENVAKTNKILGDDLNMNNIDELILLKDNIKNIAVKYPTIDLSVRLLSGDVKISNYTISDIENLIIDFLEKPEWTQQFGTSEDDYVGGVTVDSSNNIYVTGSTSGGLDGNTNSGNDCKFPPCGDIFLVKYNSGGTKQWTKQFGTSSGDSGNGVTVDSSDNIYVTGRTEGGLDGNTNSGGQDIFLVKYNSSGTKQWTQQLGTSSGDSGTEVTVDSSDSIYVSGYTSGGLDNNTNSGDYDIFLVKYNSSGTKQWTQQLGTIEKDYGFGMTVDSSDNIYVTGRTEGGLDGNTNSGGQDIFLVKYNSSGVKQWTQQFGTSEGDSGNGMTVDSSDNIYVTGSTSGGLDGNTNSGNDCKFPPCGDIFLVKYNSGGTKQWTKQFGTSEIDYGSGVTVDSSDNIYVAGGTYGGLDGNTNVGGECIIWGDNKRPCGDVILVKYNSGGVKQWTKQLGTSSDDEGHGVTVDSSNNIYVRGYTRGGLDGNTHSGNDCKNPPCKDIFLVKYNSRGL